MTDKIRQMSRVASGIKDMDSVRASMDSCNRKRAFDIVLLAQQHYNNMEQFRKDRQRNKAYTYGDQWQDRVCVDGEWMSEEQYIMQQGNVPLKNNLVRRLVRNVLGVYRGQSKEPTCTARDRDEQKYGEIMSTVLQYNMQINRMSELHARTLEDFLIGGFVMHHKRFGWRDGRLDCWTRMVSPDMAFMDAYSRDIRGWDVTFIGEIHDVSFEELVTEFARNPEDYKRLGDIYSSAKARNRAYVASFCEQFGKYRPQNIDFLIPADLSRCRVIEVWRKETKQRIRCHDYNTGNVFKIDVEDYDDLVVNENARRMEQAAQAGMNPDDVAIISAEWFVDSYWYYYYLSPFGDILAEGETPFAHRSHPYVFKAYPFLDGEIHSFVSDFIDQQRYVNRLITMYDWIMRSSAKGVLLFPEECLPEGYSLEDVADEWHRFNGIIAIKTKNNPSGVMPTQIAQNATNIGISELLNLQLKFFEDISGVNGALQGKPGYSGMSASLYAQQTQNSTTSLLDLLETYSSFVVEGAYKDVKNIQQFYDDRKVISISGRSKGDVIYEPTEIQDIEFDLNVTESTATPAYRQMANDFLMQIWGAGQISLEQLLEHGDFPFADNLLADVKARTQEMEQGQPAQALSPELMQQVQQSADMGAVNKAYNMLRPQPGGTMR